MRSLPKTPPLQIDAAWAQAHGAGAVLGLRVTMVSGLCDERLLAELGFGWSSAPRIGDVLELSAASSGWRRLQADCARFVDEQAARSQASAEAEARFLAELEPPSEPVLRAFAQALLATRAKLRSTLGPRIVDIPLPAVRFEPSPPGFSTELWLNDPLYAAKGRGSVFVDARTWREAPPPLRCSCPMAREQAGGCGHGQIALDAVLAWLSRGTSDAHARCARTLALPPWQRLLDAIDAGLAETAAAPRDHVLSWRVAQRFGSVQLTPYEHKPLRRGGVSGGSRISLAEVRAAERFQPLAVDADAAARLEDDDSDAAVYRALESLIGHPRVYLDSHPARQVRVQRGELGFSVARSDLGLRLVPTVDGETRDASALLAQLPERRTDAAGVTLPGVALLDEEHALCLLLALPAEARAVLAACAEHPHPFPAEAERALLERLPRLERVSRVQLPPELRGQEAVADPRLLLRLFALPEGVVVEGLVCPLDVGGAPPVYRPGEGPHAVTAVTDGVRVYATRDLAAELAHADGVLARLPLGPPDSPWHWQLASDEAALDLLAAIRALDEPVSCQWRDLSPRQLRLEGEVRASQLHMRVSETHDSTPARRLAEGPDWFNLDGEVELGGDRLRLADLLAALRKGSRYVRIDAARWLTIEQSLRERLERLNDALHGPRRGGASDAAAALELRPAAAPLLRELQEDAGAFTATPRWNAVVARLRHAEETEFSPPPTFQAVLRDYQRDGFQWLCRLAAWGVGGVLADDMGLGKTVQALALLVARAAGGPALVVAPTSVCFNWQREAARFAPTLRPIAWRADLDSAALGPGDLVIASYGQVTRDSARLAARPFATLVLDEAQAVKNADTQRARAVRKLGAEFRVALTGTPIENHVGELWSILRIVEPGLFGGWEEFRDRFAAPIERDKDVAKKQALARLVRPFILRRTKAGVLRELPERTDIVVPVLLSDGERRLYEDARLHAVSALADSSANQRKDARFEILAAITRLRLLACHPRLFDPSSVLPSAKLEAFLRAVSSLRENGHRALVFSQFTSHLRLVREALDAGGVPYVYLDGQTPAAERAQLVDAFQRGDGELFLISLKAGGFGLNLTAADYVMHLDPWWNPAVEEQATGRAHRIGQTRPVTVYRFVARGTIEEAMLALHRDKRALVAALLDGSDGAGKLSAQELIALISEDACK